MKYGGDVGSRMSKFVKFEEGITSMDPIKCACFFQKLVSTRVGPAYIDTGSQVLLHTCVNSSGSLARLEYWSRKNIDRHGRVFKNQFKRS